MDERRTSRWRVGLAAAALLSVVASTAEARPADSPGVDAAPLAPGPVAVELDGWQFEAATATMHGGWWTLQDAVVRRPGWVMRAETVALRLRPDRWQWIEAMRIEGRVRLQGPDKLYAAADLAISLRPTAGVDLVRAAGASPWLVVASGRWACSSIWLGWASGEVELAGVGAQGPL